MGRLGPDAVLDADGEVRDVVFAANGLSHGVGAAERVRIVLAGVVFAGSSVAIPEAAHLDRQTRSPETDVRLPAHPTLADAELRGLIVPGRVGEVVGLQAECPGDRSVAVRKERLSPGSLLAARVEPAQVLIVGDARLVEVDSVLSRASVLALRHAHPHRGPEKAVKVESPIARGGRGTSYRRPLGRALVDVTIRCRDAKPNEEKHEGGTFAHGSAFQYEERAAFTGIPAAVGVPCQSAMSDGNEQSFGYQAQPIHDAPCASA